MSWKTGVLLPLTLSGVMLAHAQNLNEKVQSVLGTSETLHILQASPSVSGSQGVYTRKDSTGVDAPEVPVNVPQSADDSTASVGHTGPQAIKQGVNTTSSPHSDFQGDDEQKNALMKKSDNFLLESLDRAYVGFLGNKNADFDDISQGGRGVSVRGGVQAHFVPQHIDWLTIHGLTYLDITQNKGTKPDSLITDAQVKFWVSSQVFQNLSLIIGERRLSAKHKGHPISQDGHFGTKAENTVSGGGKGGGLDYTNGKRNISARSSFMGKDTTGHQHFEHQAQVGTTLGGTKILGTGWFTNQENFGGAGSIENKKWNTLLVYNRLNNEDIMANKLMVSPGGGIIFYSDVGYSLDKKGLARGEGGIGWQVNKDMGQKLGLEEDELISGLTIAVGVDVVMEQFKAYLFYPLNYKKQNTPQPTGSVFDHIIRKHAFSQ